MIYVESYLRTCSFLTEDLAFSPKWMEEILGGSGWKSLRFSFYIFVSTRKGIILIDDSLGNSCSSIEGEE